jgi:PTS system nitrogen regulatory IIA component
MQLASLIIPNFVFLHGNYGSKDEIIDELIRELFRSGRYKINHTPEEVMRAVSERENLGGTLFPTGLCVPHARLENFDDILILVCVPLSPVPCGDTRIRILVLVFTGHQTSTIYLNTLAAFVKISRDTEFFTRLLACSAPHDFIQLLRERNIEVKKEFLVESIMSQNFHSLRPDNTIKDAIDAFYKYNTTYIPILEENGDFAGEISVFDIFNLGVPDYVEKVGNLKFLKSFDTFEKTLLDKENAITLREVMRKHTLSLDEDSPIIDAIVKITSAKRINIPVVRAGEKLVGIVTITDIIHKVLRA